MKIRINVTISHVKIDASEHKIGKYLLPPFKRKENKWSESKKVFFLIYNCTSEL